MAKNFDGQSLPAGNIGKPSEPSPGPGHTNQAKGLGTRRSNASLGRHFGNPRGLSSAVINMNFWSNFFEETITRYRQAPDLKKVDLKHPMYPNTAPPGSKRDDEGNVTFPSLDAVSPGSSKEDSALLPPNVNYPLPGPTPSLEGPSPKQNPSQASVDLSKVNYVFMLGRLSRHGTSAGTVE